MIHEHLSGKFRPWIKTQHIFLPIVQILLLKAIERQNAYRKVDAFSEAI